MKNGMTKDMILYINIERKRPEDEEDFTNTREFKKKKVFSSVIYLFIFLQHTDSSKIK